MSTEHQETIKQIRENAHLAQELIINVFSKTIVSMLGGNKIPVVELTYGGFFGYSIEHNLIRFKMPFNLTNINHVRAIAHECYHAYEFAGDPSKRHYSDGDREIIEKAWGEYEYKYDFERRAEVFAYAFANFYMKEVVGFNLNEAIPYISKPAKEKYPELVDIEKKMLEEYFLAKESYSALFKSHLEELIVEFEVLSKL